MCDSILYLCINIKVTFQVLYVFEKVMRFGQTHCGFVYIWKIYLSQYVNTFSVIILQNMIIFLGAGFNPRDLCSCMHIPIPVDFIEHFYIVIFALLMYYV